MGYVIQTVIIRNLYVCADIDVRGCFARFSKNKAPIYNKQQYWSRIEIIIHNVGRLEYLLGPETPQN